jgi:hypothetical protein
VGRVGHLRLSAIAKFVFFDRRLGPMNSIFSKLSLSEEKLLSRHVAAVLA